MAEKKYFTLEQANSMIPELERRFTRITQMHIQIRQLCRELIKRGLSPNKQDEIELLAPGAEGETVSQLTSMKLLITEINDQLKAIADQGCLVKDIERPLVDWYSKTEAGHEVFLCWRLGEKKICYWHEIDAGYAGRQAIETFVEKDRR